MNLVPSALHSNLMVLSPLILLAGSAVVVMLAAAFYRHPRPVMMLTLAGLVLSFASLFLSQGVGSRQVTALLVLDAAAAALEPDQCHGERERTESDLSHVLDAVDPMLPGSPGELARERMRAIMYRRLHNDAVATALSLRRRHTVRILRLARRSVDPRPFEMADGSELGWPCER